MDLFMIELLVGLVVFITLFINYLLFFMDRDMGPDFSQIVGSEKNFKRCWIPGYYMYLKNSFANKKALERIKGGFND